MAVTRKRKQPSPDSPLLARHFPAQAPALPRSETSSDDDTDEHELWRAPERSVIRLIQRTCDIPRDLAAACFQFAPGELTVRITHKDPSWFKPTVCKIRQLYPLPNGRVFVSDGDPTDTKERLFNINFDEYGDADFSVHVRSSWATSKEWIPLVTDLMMQFDTIDWNFDEAEYNSDEDSSGEGDVVSRLKNNDVFGTWRSLLGTVVISVAHYYHGDIRFKAIEIDL